nr:putative DNA binding protein [uncultured Mediterranean phage uvMED]
MNRFRSSKVEEKQIGDWSTVSELEDFAIVRTPPKGLLGTPMADVLFVYKARPGQAAKDKRKQLHLYGEEDAVFKRAIEVIDRKKNEMKRAKMHNDFVEKFRSSKFLNLNKYETMPATLLGRAIQNTGLTARKFAERSGIRAPSLYHHVSGGREISRELAIEYAAKLQCDPVDLMFEKKSIPIWSKCDLLKSTELEEDYAPGRLFSYKANEKDLEVVVVPRDIYRPDIKAIKVVARGSMYHNKVAFYYRAENKEQNYLNQLCVVGVEVPVGPIEFSNDTETHFYFGTYEEIRGKSNLINPDPYVENQNKFILQDFKPTFIAPIIVLLNPEAVVDRTHLKASLPDEKLIRKEEQLSLEIEKLKKELIIEKEYKKEAMKYAQHHAEVTKEQKKKVAQIVKEQEEQLQKMMDEVNRVTEKINSQVKEELMFIEKDAKTPLQKMKLIAGGKN